MATTSALGTGTPSFFDVEGRCIPAKLFDRVTEPDRTYRIDQPALESRIRLQRVTSFLKGSEILPADQFESSISSLLAGITSDPKIRNVLRGVHLPIGLPRIPAGLDYGEILEEAFFPVLEASYKDAFPGRQFQNNCRGRLKGRIKLVPRTRHERLLAAMNDGPVCAIFFPPALLGYSVLAARQQIESLPESFILSGPFDGAMAFAMYPQELARDKLAPGVALPGVHWRRECASVNLKPANVCLSFHYMGPLGNASSRYSNGLLYIG